MDLSGKSYKAFVERQDALKKQYSPEQAKKQHIKGKLTAEERIRLLFDKGSFERRDFIRFWKANSYILEL